jgi:uncharacterized protein YhbP (UPF0306 family)
MTIATASENNAWAAPVYYVNIGFCFYFFSNPESRHIKETLSSGQAACTIHAERSSWEELCGLQMAGRVTEVKPASEASTAIRMYVSKFPLIRSFFSSVKNLNLNSFLNKFHAKLYCFQPESTYYMDNSIEFGHRKEISKDALFK